LCKRNTTTKFKWEAEAVEHGREMEKQKSLLQDAEHRAKISEGRVKRLQENLAKVKEARTEVAAEAKMALEMRQLYKERDDLNAGLQRLFEASSHPAELKRFVSENIETWTQQVLPGFMSEFEADKSNFTRPGNSKEMSNIMERNKSAFGRCAR